MQAIKDLVCSDDPVNHQLGLMLAFTEYGKSFETFMMVLDWHSKSNHHMIELVIDIDLILYVFWGENGEVNIHLTDLEYNNLKLSCFIQHSINDNALFNIQYNNHIERNVYLIKEQLKSIYHFLTYYDII